MKNAISAIVFVLLTAVASASPVKFVVDPKHTFPSFEADHMGGLSVWRGKFRNSRGTIVLDTQARTGDVDIEVDTASIDFGLEVMNARARSAEIFDVERFPTATFKGKLIQFNDDAPTAAEGQLTLHGVTRPLVLNIRSFKCMPHPFTKKLVCGADAAAEFNRDDFGITASKEHGFSMLVKLAIQIEATKED